MTTNTAADKLTAHLTSTFTDKVAVETITGTYCVRVAGRPLSRLMDKVTDTIREFNMAQRAAGEPTVTVRFMPLLTA